MNFCAFFLLTKGATCGIMEISRRDRRERRAAQRKTAILIGGFHDAKMGKALEKQFRSAEEFETPNHFNFINLTPFHVPAWDPRFFSKVVIGQLSFDVFIGVGDNPCCLSHFSSPPLSFPTFPMLQGHNHQESVIFYLVVLMLQ